MKGWNKLGPDSSRAPCPWESVIVDEVITSSSELLPLLAAGATLLAFDTYMRPSQTFSLEKESLVAPQGRGAFAQWAVVVAPVHRHVPLKTGCYVRRHGHDRRLAASSFVDLAAGHWSLFFIDAVAHTARSSTT